MAAIDNLPEKLTRWLAQARANPRFAPAMFGAVAVAIFDQLAKAWIVHGLNLPAHGGRVEISAIFNLTYVQNYGASFGMLAGGVMSRIVLSIISVGVSLALTAWLAQVQRKIPAIGVALIIGGAIGNLIDRVSLGYVVDFLDFSGLRFPWVFNIADASINIGVALLLLDAWMMRGGKTAPRDESGPG